MPDPLVPPRQTARRFFLVAVAVGCAASAMAAELIRWFPAPKPRPDLPVLPAAFAVSTILLVVVSVSLERAIASVRRERQAPFRRWLVAALAAGAAFTSSQAWGLSALRLSPDPSDDAAGVNTFLFLFAFLHAVHVTVALLFLSHVVVQAFAERYDHEYYWGARFCAWFWHVLGLAWLVILAAFSLAAGFLYG